MSYSTLSDFKAYLWIDSSDTSQDSLLTSILNSANAKLNNLCWVDSFAKWQHTEKIEKRWIYDTEYWLEFRLKNKPVASIDSLNWDSNVWTAWTDYLIMYDRRVRFKQLELDDWWILTVVYTAWYQTIPDDIKEMEMMLWSWMRQARSYEWVSSYRLWDESITFGSKSWSNWTMTPDEMYFSFETLLNKYKNFNLPI